MSTFGERLARLRQEKGLSQAELARLLNLGQSTIAMYERNKRFPDHQILERLADFFGVSTDYLLGRAGQPPASREGLASLEALAGDPLFAGLLRQVPHLTEEEKQSLAEHWEWALRHIIKERERRIKKGGAAPTAGQGGAPPEGAGKS